MSLVISTHSVKEERKLLIGKDLDEIIKEEIDREEEREKVEVTISKIRNSKVPGKMIFN